MLLAYSGGFTLFLLRLAGEFRFPELGVYILLNEIGSKYEKKKKFETSNLTLHLVSSELQLSSLWAGYYLRLTLLLVLDYFS